MGRDERRAADRMADAAASPDESLRDRYNSFISRHVVVWEITFAALALVYVGADQLPITSEAQDLLEAGITVIFALEFFTRLAAARDRSAHLRRHIIDAIALIPPVRALRTLRLLRLTRMFSGAYRVGVMFGPLARHRGFISLVSLWIGLGIVCSLAFYTSESGVAGSMVHDPFDAIWWGVGSLSTVGSDLFPVTPEGRVAAIVLMVIGVFLFSAITATITSVLLSNTGTDETTERIGLAREIERLVDLRDRGAITADEFMEYKRLAVETVAAELRR